MKTLPLSIDIPFLYHCDGHQWSRVETMLLTDLLSDISKDLSVAVLLHEHYYEELDYANEASFRWLDDFTRMQKVIYTDDSFSPHITSAPILTDDDLGEHINHDIETSLGKMHEMGRKNETPMFVVPSSRWLEDCQTLTTTRDSHSISYHTMVLSAIESWKQLQESRYPKLNQQKHTFVGREFEDGSVSPFSAYDQRNDVAARKLLRKAYLDYRGYEEHPDYLFTWDENNGCYVEFRHSGNGEYHGMDVTTTREYNRIYKYVKEKYRK